VNVAVGASDGDTRPNTSACGTTVQPCGTCSEIRTPYSVSSPAAVSVTLTVEGCPAVIVPGALTTA